MVGVGQVAGIRGRMIGVIVGVVLWQMLSPVAVVANNLSFAVEPATVDHTTVTPEYHPETGFWVDALFNNYWQANGGLMTFGYPLSRVFYQDGIHRQYFERAIFEHHEDAAGTAWAVQLVRLGAYNTIERRKSDLPFQPRTWHPIRDRDLLFFTETGHALSPAFRRYWERYGGIQSFGYPLSDAFVEPSVEDGVPRIVQYFERGRFEHHPQLAGTDFEVLLGHLGREALHERPTPAIALEPQAATVAERNAPPIGPLPLHEPSNVDCGFNMAFWGHKDERDRNLRYLDLAVTSGCEWIRLQFPWEQIEPTGPADMETHVGAAVAIVLRAHQRGLKVLVNITHAPDWAESQDDAMPADPAALASFLERFIPYFDGRVAAWQIWNEPNLINENNGRIDPNSFFQLLKAAYLAVKRADPNALVVFPGLAPTSLNYDDWAVDDDWYLEALLNINHGEAARYFDVLGVQGYGAGNAPDTYFPSNLAEHPEWVNAPEFYFRHIEQLRAVMVNAGLGDKPIWITEMGWPVGRMNLLYGYGDYVTRELQAEYLTRAYEIIRTEWSWIDVALVWHLNTAAFDDDSSGFSGFSLVDSAGYPRPAYTAIVAMTADWRADDAR